MKIEEVLPALRDRKKIRKIGSRNYYLENDRIRENNDVESSVALFGNDCLLTNWEIISEEFKKKNEIGEK